MAMALTSPNLFHSSHTQPNGKPRNLISHLHHETTGNFVWLKYLKNHERPLYSGSIVVQALNNAPRRERNFNGMENYASRAKVEEEEKPWRLLPGGRKFYLDELDIVTILEPPINLIPLDEKTYNPAAYLWKKIGDIPEERRHRLFHLLQPRHIRRLWQTAGMRYNDANGSPNSKHASVMLSAVENKPLSPELWSGKINGVPLPIGWLRRFRTSFFLGKEGRIYGRVLPGGFLTTTVANYLSPLYFLVSNASEVMATEEPCDLAFEFGDGQLQLVDLPVGFPKPAKHPWRFNDQLVVYIRSAGPSVLVGQVWQEGTKLEQVPQKFLGELVLIRDYKIGEENAASSTTM